MASYENPWTFDGKEFDSEDIGNSYGFVYIITTPTGQKYIGRKYFWSIRKAKGKSRRQRSESDWKSYYGSSDIIKEQIKRKPADLREKDILKIHEIILDRIDKENAGIYRRVPVRISGSAVVLPNPRKVQTLMDEFFSWLENETKMHPVELASEVHYRLVIIHPFIDGNGRTARLLMNMILMMKGYPPAIIRKNDRLAYIKSLEKPQPINGVVACGRSFDEEFSR